MNRGAVLCVLATLLGGCAGSGGQPWDWDRMRTQPRYDPYAARMRAPPSGTVPRETARTATIDLNVGRARFRVFCAACHGAGGYGGSMVAANMIGTRPPSLRGVPRSRDQIYQVITNGQGRMPSYAAELDKGERRSVAAFVELLERVPRADSGAAREDSLRAVLLRISDRLQQLDSVRAPGTAELEDSLRGVQRRLITLLHRSGPR